MDKQETYEYLNSRGVQYEITEHKAVYNMADLADVELPHPEGDAKNIFVRDDKKRYYYLITVRGEKRVDLKEFRKIHGTRQLSFASENDLMKYLKLTPGAVSPLGLLNDEDHNVVWYMDQELMKGLVGVHPNDNTATIWIQAEELVRILTEAGTEVHIVEF